MSAQQGQRLTQGQGALHRDLVTSPWGRLGLEPVGALSVFPSGRKALSVTSPKCKVPTSQLFPECIRRSPAPKMHCGERGPRPAACGPPPSGCPPGDPCPSVHVTFPEACDDLSVVAETVLPKRVGANFFLFFFLPTTH